MATSLNSERLKTCSQRHRAWIWICAVVLLLTILVVLGRIPKLHYESLTKIDIQPGKNKRYSPKLQSNQTYGMYMVFQKAQDVAKEVSKNSNLRPCRKTYSEPYANPEDYKPPVLSKQEHSLTGTDLAAYLCRQWILNPFREFPNLMYPDKRHFSILGQSEIADGLLKHRLKGFFIDLSPGLGEIGSNTLFFQKSMGWTGLSIEPRSFDFKAILNTKPTLYTLNACLSPNQTPVTKLLKNRKHFQGLHGKPYHGNETRDETAQCFPLKSILEAINIQRADYLSLDLSEIDVSIIKSLPPELGIEVINIDLSCDADSINGKKDDSALKLLASVRKFLEDSGYTLMKQGGSCE